MRDIPVEQVLAAAQAAIRTAQATQAQGAATLI
jgi:hypothetical protein